MKSRSEVFSIFKTFCSEINTQFGTHIKILQSDNAREYLSTSFQSFLTSQGILHQTSCAHTPQQNGVAERKNRHLVETARTMLLHNNVPPRFWGDAILTACYLINRMPSFVLKNQVPHSILFPRQHLYSLPLRIFGCTCFVHDLTPGKDKLAAKSLKCLFLGYSRLQKGYRCYSPVLRRYIVSADVSFFETCPFFPSTPEEPNDNSSSQSFTPEVINLPIAPAPVSVPTPVSTDTPALRVYQRRPRPTPVLPDSSPAPSDSHTPHSTPELLPIAQGNRSSRNPNPIYACHLDYHQLSPSYSAFVVSLDSVSIPKTTGEAMSDPGWRQAMVDEMAALHSNGTWDLVPLPDGKTTVGCQWVYTVKVGSDGKIDRLKSPRGQRIYPNIRP